VTDAQLEEIKQNRLLLYAFLAVRYEDESAEGKYYWTLQFCGYFTAAMTYWHNCAPYEVNKVEGRRFKR